MAKGCHPSSALRPTLPGSCESNNHIVQDLIMNSASRAGLTLPLANTMAIPVYTAAQSIEEVNYGGQYLFHDFIHHQFESENLSDEEIVSHDPIPTGAEGDVGPVQMSPVTASTPDGYSNENLLRIGSSIRELADQFKHSKERPLIRDQAEQVELENINEEAFFQLLREIFRGGINAQRIVALFYFCSDVLMRCVRQKLRQQGIRLFTWSLRYLINHVCQWVHDNGGWERVFSNIYKVVYRVCTIAALGVLISCGFIWMRKNL